MTNLVSAVDSNFGSLELTRTYGAKKNNRRQFALNSQSTGFRGKMKKKDFILDDETNHDDDDF